MSKSKYNIKQTSFRNEGYKRIMCPECGHFLKESRFGDKPINKKCAGCGVVSLITPPAKKITDSGEKVIVFGFNNSSSTADCISSDTYWTLL